MKKILAASFILVVAGLHFAQTPPPNCQSGSPKCYSNLVAYNGHGPASSLPSSLCSNCNGDNRRVIVVRIHSSWGTTTNTNVWNAVNCAIGAWNSATDSSGNKTGYYFVLDQDNDTGVTTADITIKQDTSQSGLAENDVNVNPGSGTRTNNIELSSANGTLGNGSFTANDLCGRVKHEMGHLIGLGNNSLCNTIMRGSQEAGTRLVNDIQANDVARVNAHFADVDNCGNSTTSQDTSGEQFEPTPTPTPTPEPTPTPCASQGQGCGWDGDCCDGMVCGELTWQCVPCQNDNNSPSSGCMSEACIYCYQVGGVYCDPWTSSCWTPLVVDIAGNGLDMTDVANGIRFDGFGRGQKIRTGWTKANSDDAWLVLDRNGNGQIDSGVELFSSAAPQPMLPPPDVRHGFNALVQYDKAENGGNGDGKLSSADAIFSSLQLWQDVNHNGVSEASELHTLAALGLKSIDLDYRLSKRTDKFGNTFRYRAKATDEHGGKIARWIFDVYPVAEP